MVTGASVGVLDREMRAEGWMISPSRLRDVVESTPIPTTSRLGDAFESTRRSVRVESKLQGLQAVGNKKGADSSESTPETTY